MRAPEMSQGDMLALHSQLSSIPDTGPPALNLSSQIFTMRKKLLTMSCNISDKCHVLFQVSLGTAFPSHSPHGLSRLHVSVWSELNPRVLRSDLVGIRRRPQAQPFCPELPKATPKFCVQGQSSDGNSHGPALPSPPSCQTSSPSFCFPSLNLSHAHLWFFLKDVETILSRMLHFPKAQMPYVSSTLSPLICPLPCFHFPTSDLVPVLFLFAVYTSEHRLCGPESFCSLWKSGLGTILGRWQTLKNCLLS